MRSWLFDEPVVALALSSERGVWLVALASKLVWWWPATDRRQDHGFRLPGFPQVRFNDGRPDPLAGFERGLPDGSAMDSEGCLWNCRFFGHCIVRVNPQGEIDRVIEMPVKNITTATFGGADLKTLYVTSAAGLRDTGERLAGSLWAVRCDVAGLPEHRVLMPR